MTEFVTTRSGQPSRKSTSEILQEMAELDEPSVPVREFAAAMGSRAHGILLVLFALPDAIPLPIPSVSAIIGIPLVLIAGHLVIFGEDSGLPKRVLAAKIPTSVLRFTALYGAPILRFLEFFTRPRWHAVLERERLLGLVCLYLAVLLLLPIPFINLPPAICIVVIAMGMVQRDGILVTIGLVLTAVISASLGFAARWIMDFFGGG